MPQDEVAFLPGLAEDVAVIDPGIYRGSLHDVPLVVLAFLNDAFEPFEVNEGREPLGALRGQITVGHGDVESPRDSSRGFEVGSNPSRHRALPQPVPTAQIEMTMSLTIAEKAPRPWKRATAAAFLTVLSD
jgi:hypothetical protein